jgi:hypothetical protein
MMTRDVLVGDDGRPRLAETGDQQFAGARHEIGADEDVVGSRAEVDADGLAGNLGRGLLSVRHGSSGRLPRRRPGCLREDRGGSPAR